MLKSVRLSRLALAPLLVFSLATVFTARAATPPPASGDLLVPATVDLSAFKTEKDPVLSLDSSTDAPAIRVEFPGNSGYPGVDLPIPGGSWDLSAYSAVEVELANISQARLNIGLRIDNPGDWKKSPWNSGTVWLSPGETKKLKVTFGESYGRPGYALDPSRVNRIKILADNPKQTAAILIKSVRAVGAASASNGVSSPAPARTVAVIPAAASTATAAPAAVLFTPTADNIGSIKTEKDPVLSLDTSTDTPALKVEFIGGSGYPGFDFPISGNLNLSGFAGIQVDVTNISQSRLNLNLRADNPGDWKKSPWNTNNAWVAPGETKTVKLTFGQSYGNPGYLLDASRISVIKLFAATPKLTSAVLVKNLRPFGTATAAAASPFGSTSEPAPIATAPAAPAGEAGTDATFSPAIDGELLNLSKSNPLAGFNYNESSAVVENGKIKVTFNAGSNYPNIQFPIPKGGWNLSAFGGIELTVTNPTASKVRVFLRADNPGHWKAEPWNTENLTLGVGETKTIKLTFGQQNGAPAFPLNPARIIAIQLFTNRPKPDTTLLLSGLKASGSPADAANKLSLSKPEDRNVPAVLPAWLGQRPPVEIPGEWVKTLDENFDGNKLNDKLWTPRFPWDGPQPGQLQRYAPENVIVGNGVAAFKVEKRHGHENNDPSRPTREYTSGLIQSYDKWTQLYGYFEARIKVPYVRGLWPAYWMMPDRGPSAGSQWKRRDTGNGGMEIDIMEILSEWGPGRNSVATHWDGYGADHKQWGTSQIYYGPTADGWHVYGLLWEPGKLTWFVDGKKLAEWQNERVGSVPTYLKFNVQLGGWATKNVDDASLPAVMEVDYTRAWQLKSRQ
ncbi:MAG: glycoside hydrolase family 16 [Rariglobus sp.]|jgi:beta-glucanase (GH16 family)|nr:glycoside hydrolase family 16 [Rariglobus sp.]